MFEFEYLKNVMTKYSERSAYIFCRATSKVNMLYENMHNF